MIELPIEEFITVEQKDLLLKKLTGFENERQRVARKVTGSSMAAVGNGRRARAGQN